MSTMAMNNVCRLCLATDNLLYIFDDENTRLNMKDIISLSTGIEIHKKDIISQKICEKCYEFSIQIFQFRGQCLKADKYLKTLCMDYLVDKKHYIPNTEVTIKGVPKEEVEHKPNPIFTKQLSEYEIHPSIIKLSHVYPKMKLPRFCIGYNVTPIVEMELDQVENYFQRLNLDFNVYLKNTLSIQSPLLALSKEITIRRVNRPHKDPSSKPQNKIVEIRKSHLKNPALSNIRRKYLDNSIKESVVEKTEDTQTKRKRQHSTVDSEINNPFDIIFKKRARSGRIMFRDADTIYSSNPSKKRRKSSLTDHALNDDTRPKPRKSPQKTKEIFDKYIEPTIPSLTQNHEDKDCEPLTNLDRSVRLFICQICSSVRYTALDLKKHMIKHMKCQFCKVRFRTMESKTDHIDNSCMIRKMMNQLPLVELTRIENCANARKNYPGAFKLFTSLPPLDLDTITVLSDDMDEPFFRGFPRDKDVIEILSDDEDMTFPPTPKDYPPILPDIRSDVFGKSDSQSDVLKNIVTMIQPALKDLQTQSDLPSDADVTIVENYRALLKNLMPLMAFYNIFVKIQHGEFNVTYDYNIKSSKDKKLCLWDHMTPIDVKFNDENC